LTESDSELLQRCRQGDEAAWRDLVARHTRRVFSLAYRFVGRVDEAEDLTQDIFVKVYQNLDRYHSGQGAFSTWLTAVARNLSIDNHRKRREERMRRIDGEGLVENLRSPDEGPQKRLEREERVTLVRSGLKALPQELREPIILCDLQGLPYEEVATILGVPLGTVKSRLNRGRLELARRLLARRHAQVRPS
jgi:RNA polymerase sigma-70 factor (ECF subfamily)